MFYICVHLGILNSQFVRRYFAGHPVEYVETAMFFVGLSALILKLVSVASQFASLRQVTLTADQPDSGSLRVEDAACFIDKLKKLPDHVANSYLALRLKDALTHVRRKGTADDLDEELKYLSDLDQARQHQGYALVRIIIWATPMLGFLGTVIGITLALGDLSPQSLVNSPETAMQGLLAGLSVAFDTTALALSLSILLMFAQYITNHLESELLASVDSRVSKELVGRFEQLGTRTDPQLASIRQMTDAVIRSTRELVNAQAEVWRDAITEARDSWQTVTESVGENLQADVTEKLNDTLERHTSHLLSSAKTAEEDAQRNWERLLDALSQNAQVMNMQQAELVKQGDTLLRVVQATGEVASLEETLNENLRALAGSKNFEDTVMSLSAAIHLLNSRMGHVDDRERPVRLESVGPEERAA